MSVTSATTSTPATGSTGTTVTSTPATVSSTTSGTGTGLTQASGLASGIDSAAIINALIQADSIPLSQLQSKQSLDQAHLDALRSLNTKLLSAQLDFAALNKSSTFQNSTATSSDSAALTATAGSGAVQGTYQLDVVAIAKASQVATAGQSSASDLLGGGTVSIQLGSGAATTLTIDAANSSLTGIAQAINSAGLGVAAAVVSDGSASPNRLIITSKSTGIANAATVSGGGALAGLFSGATTLTPAADAQVRIGSGTGAITITQASNTFTGVVPGVSLTAIKPEDGLAVTVGDDPTVAHQAITAFVQSYNAAKQYLSDNASYDATSNVSGVLFTDGDVLRGFDGVTAALTGPVAGAPAGSGSLEALGISIDQQTGQLSVDDSTLNAALAANPDGVRQFFTNSGASSNPGVSFAALGTKTVTTNPFAIAITTAASQARAGASDLAASTDITSTTKNLFVTVNGHAYSLTLNEGTYTRSQLASQLQTAFDAATSAVPGDKVVVGLSGNALNVRTQSYGNGQTIDIDPSSSALPALELYSGTVRGTDVAGTIDGVAATGLGQVLSGAAGTAAEGLKLVVTLGAPAGNISLTASRGMAQSASDAIQGLTDATAGVIGGEADGLSSDIASLTDQITQFNANLDLRRQRYQEQFDNMETLIQSFNSQGQFMTNYIKSLTPSSA